MTSEFEFSMALDVIAEATGLSRNGMADLEDALDALQPPSKETIMQFIVKIADIADSEDPKKLSVMLQEGVTHVIDELDATVSSTLKKALDKLNVK